MSDPEILDGTPVALGGPRGLDVTRTLPNKHRRPAFSQHADLPVVTSGGLAATVLMGELGGARSPARCHTPLLGAELTLAAGSRSVLPLRPDFEYAVLVLGGAATVAGRAVRPGPLHYLDEGRSEIRLETDSGARLMLLGGEPFAERIVMWWNFVGRDHDEIVAARQACEDRELLPPESGLVDGTSPGWWPAAGRAELGRSTSAGRTKSA